MDSICGLADMLRDTAFDRLKEYLRYVASYKENIEELNERLSDLRRRRKSVQHQVDEATNNADKIEEEVVHWLHKVDELTKQVEELNKEENPNMWMRYKLSKRAEEMTQQVNRIYKEGKFKRVSYHVTPEPIDMESNEEIYPRVTIMNQLLETLQNPSVNMIGLCGLGGAGKSTIAKEVEKWAYKENKFEKVIMARVTTDLNIKKVQRKIAEKLCMTNIRYEDAEDKIAFDLRERLKGVKNMLLILDDLWEELDLRKLGIRVERKIIKNEGFKIIITSRDKSLLISGMKCQNIIDVGVLLEDEAWELFKTNAEISSDSSGPELMSIAYEIVEKCGGLPLAIDTAAKSLRNKDLAEWKDALARLNKPTIGRNITGFEKVDAILRLSYDRLSSFEQRRIFLLTSMLSHDASIEDLLMYSVGLDLFPHIESMDEAYSGIDAKVSQLKSLNLFLESFSRNHVTLHDFFRDFALSIACNELHAYVVRDRALKEWPDENRLKDCKEICLQECDITIDFPQELHGPKLEFFLLNNENIDLTIPNMFFKSAKHLKVLAFTNVHFSSLPSLSFLQKLKALCLHSCVLKDITEVRSLINLKVLSLAYSDIEQLPIGLAKLTSLQMLNLSHCTYLQSIPEKILSNFKKLEVLYMGDSFDHWKVKGSSEANKNASLDELRDLPIAYLNIQIPSESMLPNNLFLNMKLERYRIFIGKHGKWIDNYETSNILKLELEESSIHLMSGVRKLLEGVEHLYLLGYNVIEKVLHSIDGREFPHLRHLQIKSDYEITYDDDSDSPLHEAATDKLFQSLFNKKVLLPKLESLKLSGLSNLIPLIWDDQLSYNSFRNMKTLIVKNCGLVKLLPLHVVKSLNNLEELKVAHCDKLEMVFDFEDLNDDKEIESSSLIVPLKKLKLMRLPKLKNVWSNHHHQGNVSFHSLQSVYVSYCESLTSIFPASIAKGMLYNLEELYIDSCEIDAIVEKDKVSESDSPALFEFSRLTFLHLEWLSNLKNFYPQRHTLQCPQLQQLSILWCDELEIFGKEDSSSLEIHEEESSLDSKYPQLYHDKVFPNLEELTLIIKEAEITVCDQFPMHHFPKIKLLHLRLQGTTFRYGSLLKKSFPNLEELELSGDFKEAFGGNDVATSTAPFSKLSISRFSNIMSLGQSLVLSSQNLTHLEVGNSPGLTTLMTLSTALSLVHLTHLSISNCFEMEEIILKQEGENGEDKEIVFSKLEFLELSGLRSLKRFCSHKYTFRFLFLECVTISECPQLTVFCSGAIHTPRLQSIQLDYLECWNTNLNKTLFYRRFDESSGELIFDENYVGMVKSDQFPFECCPEVEILRIDGFQDEDVKFAYTFLNRFPQLNALHVESSSFEEIFPSYAHVVDQIPPFKLLYLTNLTVLKVYKCHELVYLMTNSTAKSLVNLEALEIVDCEKLEEIVRNDNEDAEDEITFLRLSIVKLVDLPRLKTEKNERFFNIEDS